MCSTFRFHRVFNMRVQQQTNKELSENSNFFIDVAHHYHALNVNALIFVGNIVCGLVKNINIHVFGSQFMDVLLATCCTR
jgi:hypothetical protein